MNRIRFFFRHDCDFAVQRVKYRMPRKITNVLRRRNRGDLAKFVGACEARNSPSALRACAMIDYTTVHPTRRDTIPARYQRLSYSRFVYRIPDTGHRSRSEEGGTYGRDLECKDIDYNRARVFSGGGE